MKKTQDLLRRAGAAALALTMTVGLCRPAFAATKAPFSKDETVYAVMAADGSVQKTTVSEHLYAADGLAGVEDKSTLKNIVNTESFAEYTRNGDTLVWNTGDTDVYYKGDTDRPLPISAKVTYTLDGRTAPLSELLGQSGHLVLTIDLTNNEKGTLTVDGKERTVVTPLVTAVGVVLGGDARNVNAVNGLLESAAKSSVAAFVALPGVKASLDGLLPQQVDGVTRYLQDSLTVEADVEELTAPQILLACAATAEALGQGDEVFDLDSLNGLTDGIAALNDAMSQLLDGASQLRAGAAQLAAGSLALLDGVNQLDGGLGQLTEGLDTLTSNNAALTSGAQQVADGVLDSANQTLMENGLIDTPMTWDTYEAVIDDILSLGEKTLAAGRKKMVRTIWEQAPQFKASQLDIALYLAATKTGHDLEAALRLMQSFSPDFIVGWLPMLGRRSTMSWSTRPPTVRTWPASAPSRKIWDRSGSSCPASASTPTAWPQLPRALTPPRRAAPGWSAAHPPCMRACSSSRTAPTSSAAALCSSTPRASLSSPAHWTPTSSTPCRPWWRR